MASTANPSVPTTAAPVTTSPEAAVHSPFVAKLEKHKKPLAYGAGFLVLLALVAWLYTVSSRNKEAMASDGLDAARTALESGNLPAASAGFQRVSQTFGGTDAAFQAQLGLNEVRLASGQAQLAVADLRKFAQTNPPALYASGAWLMMGGGLETLANFDEAAAAYLKAEEIATEDYRKVEALLGAARAYHLAKKDKQSVDVLRGIVSKYPKDTPGGAEARVRLAEQTRGTM